MREFKFRAWNHKAKTMYHDVDLLGGHAAKDGHWLCYCKDDKIMQFTGLQDKDGKEIYEGDILLTDEEGWIAPVVWQHGAFVLVIKKPFEKGGGFSTEPNWDKCEVIGNIYANPELLEPK